jgi:hypothetical protein
MALIKSLIVTVVLVPDAAFAVIGTTLVIWQVGIGSVIVSIGKTGIGSGVMVLHVIVLIIMLVLMILMLAYVKITFRVVFSETFSFDFTL